MKREIVAMLKRMFKRFGKEAMKGAAKALVLKLLKKSIINGVVWVHEKFWDYVWYLGAWMPMKGYIKWCRKNDIDWRPGYVMSLGRNDEERRELAKAVDILDEYEFYMAHKDDVDYYARMNYAPTNPWQCCEA